MVRVRGVRRPCTLGPLQAAMKEGRWRGTADAEERRDLKMDGRAADLGFAGLFIRLRIDLSRWIGDGRSGEVGL